jgi:hypothetical protein
MMKRSRASQLAYLSLGTLLVIVVAQLLGASWVGTVRFRTINNLCAAHAPWLAGHALFLWLQIPSWFIAVISGLYIGVKRYRFWLVDSCLFSIFYVIGSYILPRLAWGPVIRFPSLYLWLLDFISVPLALGAAFLGQRHIWQKLRALADVPYCPVCAYSLRGNTSGICPECGAAVSEEAKAALRGAPGPSVE